jgi:hypothetical protein
MANVLSPRKVVEAVRACLAPHGVFVFETGYLGYLAEDCVFDNIYHEHIDYYAVTPLVRFFESLGMEMFDVQCSNSKGSSIRCYVSRSERCEPVSPEVGRLVARERDFGYQTPKPYEALGRKLDRVKDAIHDLLQPVLADGGTVAGFGASVGVTTVLYHFDLGHSLAMLLDDNPSRQNLASPGLGLPVRSPEVLMHSDRPRMVLLLAWRYADAIIKRHRSYSELGGVFATILPEVSIVTLA